MAAKRSPILGYNHNVRYRGLVFHVQTEDSGVLSPHLFTHLFYEGVIVSTRKLVYDSGAAEDAIKALMQAQHKAVLKDLKKGSFDDKIDQYLGGTPGLLPRGEAGGDDAASRDSSPALRDSQPLIPTAAASQPAIPVSVPESPTIPTSPPVVTPPAGVPIPRAPTPSPPGIPRAPTPLSQPTVRPGIPPAPGRAITMDRTSGSASMRAATPPALGSAPTVMDLQPPAAPTVHDLAPPVAPTLLDVRVPGITPGAAPTVMDLQPPPPMDDPPTLLDPSGAINAAMGTAKDALIGGPPVPDEFPDVASSPEIEIAVTLEVDDDDSDARVRPHRDTDVSTPVPIVDTPSRPVVVGDRWNTMRTPVIADPDRVRPDMSPEKRTSVGASALPPAKPPTRPPAINAVARPLTNTEVRGRDSDSVEVYAPPPSADTPPAERPGQYSLRRNKPAPPPIVERDRTGPNAIPAGLARPPRTGPVRTGPNVTIQEPVAPPPPRRGSEPMPPLRRPDPPPRPPTTGQRAVVDSKPPTGPKPIQRPVGGPNPAEEAPPRARGTDDTGPRPRPNAESIPAGDPRPRSPTPARIAPMPSRTQSSNSPSPVVMTRPAVIVGAPAKTPPPRVRKAREDEGRGFGQGLISEKSLDEVILAYLSEDAEEK